MKVFSWMHRHFLHAHLCNTYLQDRGLEKDVISKADVEKHALLEHGGQHVVMDVVNGDWKHGILSIGTLAISPLELEIEKYEIIKEVQDHHDGENNHNHPDIHDDDDDDAMHDVQNLKDKDDDLEGSPLIMKMTLFSHELLGKVDVVDTCNEIEEVCEDSAMLKDNINGIGMTDNNNGFQIKRRVTLADLFSEDSDHQLVKILRETDAQNNNDITNVDGKLPPSLENKMNKPIFTSTKNGLSKAKKLLKDEFRPIKKLNQLMRRVMKKKIHPDLEGKLQKKDIHMQSSTNAFEIPTNKKYGPNLSASLLLIQDPMA